MTKKTLSFILTSRCNFSCKFCLRKISSKDLPISLAKEILIQAKTYHFSNINFTGGEPLLYPDLEKITKLIVKKGFILSFVTNGYLFKENVSLLRGCRNLLGTITFSLEDHNPEIHDYLRQRGSFDRLLEAFRICRKEHFRFGIMTEVNSLNYDHIFDIAKLAQKEKAAWIVFVPVLPCSRAKNNGLVLSDEKRRQLYYIIEGIREIIDFPIGESCMLFSPNSFLPCCYLDMRELRIDLNGDLLFCNVLGDLGTRKVIASVPKVGLKKALLLYNKSVYEFTNDRINNLEDSANFDFNNCFYCLKKYRIV